MIHRRETPRFQGPNAPAITRKERIPWYERFSGLDRLVHISAVLRKFDDSKGRGVLPGRPGPRRRQRTFARPTTEHFGGIHPIFPVADNLERPGDLMSLIPASTVEFPPFVVERSSSVHLFPDNDTGHTFHIATMSTRIALSSPSCAVLRSRACRHSPTSLNLKNLSVSYERFLGLHNFTDGHAWFTNTKYPKPFRFQRPWFFRCRFR